MSTDIRHTLPTPTPKSATSQEPPSQVVPYSVPATPSSGPPACPDPLGRSPSQPRFVPRAMRYMPPFEEIVSGMEP